MPKNNETVRSPSSVTFTVNLTGHRDISPSTILSPISMDVIFKSFPSLINTSRSTSIEDTSLSIEASRGNTYM